MRSFRANVRESEVETLRSGSGRDTRGNDRESDSTIVLLYGSYADDEATMTMNLNTPYKQAREIAGETAWILEKMEEYERGAAVTHPRFTEAMRDPTQPARRIVEIMYGTAHPIGYLIQEIHADKDGNRLAMLLMAGMTGIIKATNAIDAQMAEILYPKRITVFGS